MKRNVRTYLSFVLLLCLAVQLLPLAAIHSHEEHHSNQFEQLDHHDLASDSDFSFESADDCNLCDLLLALNDQHLSFVQALEYNLNNSTVDIARKDVQFVKEALSNAIRGRAPPIA